METAGRRSREEIKVEIVFEKGGQKKVNIGEVVSVFMALWKIKAFGPFLLLGAVMMDFG